MARRLISFTFDLLSLDGARRPLHSSSPDYRRVTPTWGTAGPLSASGGTTDKTPTPLRSITYRRMGLGDTHDVNRQG